MFYKGVLGAALVLFTVNSFTPQLHEREGITMLLL